MSRRLGGLRLKQRPVFCAKCRKRMNEPGLTLKMLHEATCRGKIKLPAAKPNKS